MNDTNLVNDNLRKEADEFLYGKGLYSGLEKFGHVKITGSYSLKLMTWRDLDIYLVEENMSLSNFFEIGSFVANLLSPTKMHFRNERLNKSAGLPHGLYWGIYLGDERNGAWKIDIWVISHSQCAALDEFSNKYKDIPEKSRSIILDIKSKCWMKSGYRRSYTSIDIYDAVLSHGIEDIAGFETYLKCTKRCSLDA